MKTYLFVSKNSSACITLSAPNEDEAWKTLEGLVKPESNDFRLDEEEED